MPPKRTIIYDIGTRLLGHSQVGALKFNPHENAQDLEAVFEKLRSDGVRFSIFVDYDHGKDVEVLIDGEETIGQDPIGTFLYAVWSRYCRHE